MSDKLQLSGSITATGSHSSKTPSKGKITDGKEVAEPALVRFHHPDTSIAVADHVIVSRSAESVGLVVDQSRPSRMRASRHGTPSPGRRGGAGAGSSNRIPPTGCSAQVKNVLARKSKSGTALSEKLRLDYTFEKPSSSDDVFPSMFEELLRSFEEEDNPGSDPSVDINRELALIMSGVLSDEDDESLLLPEKLLYKMLANKPIMHSNRYTISTSAADNYFVNVAPETSKICESEIMSNTSLLSSSATDFQVRPRPPCPPEDGISTIASDVNVLPSTSVSLNSCAINNTSKQIYVAYEPCHILAPSKTLQKFDDLHSIEKNNDSKIEETAKSPSLSNHSLIKEDQAGQEKSLENSLKCSSERSRDMQRHEVLPNTTVLSFGMLPEACKGYNERTLCKERNTDFAIRDIPKMLNAKTVTSPCVPDRTSPACTIECSDDRIRSDKRIPLPEEILLAINRAIELGELKAQGDSDTIKALPSGSDTGVSFRTNQTGTQVNMLPSKSLKFPHGEQTSFSSLQPFSYFKISSSQPTLFNMTPKEGNCKLPASADRSENNDNVLSARLLTKRTVGSGPLYRKSCEKSEEKRSKAAMGSESISEPLSTPPNTPIRSKAGITFSDPIATCVTDCNTNMARSSDNHKRCESTGPISDERSPQRSLKTPANTKQGGDAQTEAKNRATYPKTEGVSKYTVAHKEEGKGENVYNTSPATKRRNVYDCSCPKTTLTSHPSILLKPQEYLNFYAFLRSKTPVTKEVRKPKTKIFKLQRMMTDPMHDTGTRDVSPDPEDCEVGFQPIFPRGREVPPGWKPGEHGSHPITQISAEYEMAAQNSTKIKKHVWKKSKVRKKGYRVRDNRLFVKQSASDTSDVASPQMAAKKKSQLFTQDSSDDTAVVSKTEFERKRRFYERELKSTSSNEGHSGKSTKRNKPKKVTEQVTFLKTIDDICNAEEDYSEDDVSLSLEGYDENLLRCQQADYQIRSSLAKYYTNKIASSAPRGDFAEIESSLTNVSGVRIARANLQVPSAMSQERLRAICPTSPQGTGGQGSRWPRRTHNLHPHLPASSAKWPESSLDIANVQTFKRNPRKPHRNDAESISPSKIGVNLDYREAWDQLRANFVDIKNEQHQSSLDGSSDQPKKDTKEDKRNPAKSENSSPLKKTPAAKLIAGLKEKSKSFKPRQMTKLPAPPDRSEEDTWCYSVNAMLLKAKQVMADGQKKGTHRFPRHNSAAVVSPVIDQKATSSFLKTLLKQDAEEFRQSKMAASAQTEADIRQQRDRIRIAVSKTATGKTFSKGRLQNKSCNADSSTSTLEYDGEPCLSTITMHNSSNAPATNFSAGRIHRPLDGRLPGNRHSKKEHIEEKPLRNPLRRSFPGSSYILDQTLHYYDYPYITENSIVPLFGNTNSNALSDIAFNENSMSLGELVSSFPINVQKCNPITKTDSVHEVEIHNKAGSVCKDKYLVNLIRNNNAILARQEIHASPIINKSFRCSAVEKNDVQNVSSSNIYFGRNFNQNFLLDSLLNWKMKKHISKRKPIPKEQIMGFSLAAAKENADAAYEMFLDQSKPIRLSAHCEVLAKSNTDDELDKPSESKTIGDNDSFGKSSFSQDLRSKKGQFSISTESYDPKLITKCVKSNKFFSTNVNPISIPFKAKPLKNKAVRRGCAHIPPSCSVHKAIPLIILGAPKEIQVLKNTSNGKHKCCHGSRANETHRNTDNNQQRRAKSKDRCGNSQISGGGNANDAALDQECFQKNICFEPSFLQRNELKAIRQSHDKCLQSKFVEHSGLENKTSVSRERHFKDKDFQRSIAMMENANDTEERWNYDYEQFSVENTLRRQVANAEKIPESAKVNHLKGFTHCGDNTINLEQYENDGSCRSLPSLKFGTYEEELIKDLRLKQLCNIAKTKEPFFIKDASLTQTRYAPKIEENPLVFNDDNDNNTDSGCCYLAGKETERVYKTEDWLGSCQEINDVIKSLNSTSLGEESIKEQEKLDNWNKATVLESCEIKNELSDSSVCKEERPLYDNYLDPDYMCMSGYNIEEIESSMHDKSRVQSVDELGNSCEITLQSPSIGCTLDTSFLPSAIKRGQSESNVLLARETPVLVLPSEKLKDQCSDHSLRSDVDHKNRNQISSSLENSGRGDSVPLYSESPFNDREQQQTGSSTTPIRSRAAILIPCSNSDDISVRDAQSKTSLDCSLPNTLENTPCSPAFEFSAMNTYTDTDTEHHLHELEDCRKIKVNSDKTKREILSVRPPPPTPLGHSEKLTYDNTKYTLCYELGVDVNMLNYRREQLLLGLNAAVTSFFFVPVFILNKWEERTASSTVLKVHFCSEYAAKPKYCVDKEGCRVSKITPFTVFYRQDSRGFPMCLYTVQWLGRGLYSLKNRDVISDNQHIGMVKLGSLLDHSLQSGSQPPGLEHYPLLLLGAPTSKKSEAMKEANKAHSTPTKNCQVSTIVNLLLGVTPWWTLPAQENQFLGPTRLSSCLTAKNYGTDNCLPYNDGYLRDMMVQGADVPTLIRSFQETATFSNQSPTIYTGKRKTLESIRKEKQMPNSEMFWSGPSAKKATPNSFLQNDGQETSSVTYKLPDITVCNQRDTSGHFSFRHKNSDTEKLPVDKKPCERSMVECNEKADLGVIGLRTPLSKRCNLPPVGNTTRQSLCQNVQRADRATSLDQNTPSRRLLDLTLNPSSSCATNAKGWQMRGWEWSRTVLPPPFPDNLRPSKARKKTSRRFKLIRGRHRTKVSKRKPMKKRSRCSLKSYSSGPSTSSSSEDERSSLNEVVKQFVHDGRTPKTLNDIISNITHGSNIPLRVKKYLEAKKQQEKQEAEEERRILSGDAGGDSTGNALSSALTEASSQMIVPSPRSAMNREISVLAGYDMLSDVEEVKEVWANCFPKVRFSTKKQRWCHEKQSRRREARAQAAVMLGLGYLV